MAAGVFLFLHLCPPLFSRESSTHDKGGPRRGGENKANEEQMFPKKNTHAQAHTYAG